MKNKLPFLKCVLVGLIIMIFVNPSLLKSQNGINLIGTFEGEMPSYWGIGNEPAGSQLSWATDESRSMGRSLKIQKEATSETAYWESDNMVDFWADRHFKDVDLKFGAYYKTMNVNTDPANDDEKWYISYTFYDEAGSEIGTRKFELDQSVASTEGWVADTTDVGEIVLPVDAWTTIITFVGGKDATGSVWADDFILTGRDGWGGGIWNNTVGVPTGWIYWLPGAAGDLIGNGYGNTVVTTEEAHSGLHSLKFDLPFDRAPQDAFVGTKRMLLNPEETASVKSVKPLLTLTDDITALTDISAGDVLRVSVWVKAENLVPDSAAAYPVTWAVGFTYGFFKSNGNNDGFNNVDGYPVDMQFVFPAVEYFDWTQYYIDITVPDSPEAKAIAIRLHPYSRFTGTIFFDDLSIEKLDIPKIAEIGSFEGDMPSYWGIGSEPAGSQLTWAMDESRSMGRSLKIQKEATSETAYWESDNMVDFWADRHFKDVDLKFGAYYKTMNVNTDPANDDEKWYISYTFYDEAGSEIGTRKFELDQSVASTEGWVADTTDVGEIVLPVDAWTTIITFVGGKDATGSVWADDFILTGRDGWGGGIWNNTVGVPTGWIYWLPGAAGDLIGNGYGNTVVTADEAYTGLHSLKFDLPFDRAPQDAFVGTKRFYLNKNGTVPTKANVTSKDFTMLNNAKAGDVLRISVMVKAENLVPDSAAAYPVTWAVGFTYGFFKSDGNNDGFNNVDGYPVDMQFVFPAVQSFDWTPYFIDIEVPENPEAKCIAVRLHPYSRFTGTVWFDDLQIEVIDVVF